jgi:hypothetical protein
MLRKGRWRRPRAWAEASTAGAIVAVGVVLNVGRNVWYWWHGQLGGWFVANVGTLDDALRVPNRVRDYIPLDVPVFLASPWVDSRDDSTGRANFWNYLLRSSLTGEFGFDGALHRAIAIAWGVALLWLLVLLALRLHEERWSVPLLWREAPWLALSLAWVGSILCARIANPYACGGDFRYVLPVLVPFIVASVRAGRQARGLLALMALGSAVFFVTL